MPAALISGANRGLGLEFVKQYEAAGWRVFACCRAPSVADELAALAARADGRITLHALDVDDHGSIEALSAGLAAEPIDVLVNNAGVYHIGERFGAIDYDQWTRALRTNLFGPMKMAEAFADQVARSTRKVIATLSSGFSSITNARADHIVSYRTSKCAVNMVTKLLADELTARGIIVVALGPGWADTRMGRLSLGRGGNPADMIDPAHSIACLRAIIDGLTPADGGRCILYTGADIPR